MSDEGSLVVMAVGEFELSVSPLSELTVLDINGYSFQIHWKL
jgi:hypothetical protein